MSGRSNKNASAAAGLRAAQSAAQGSRGSRVAYAFARMLAGALLSCGTLWGVAGLCVLGVPVPLLFGLSALGGAVVSFAALFQKGPLVVPAIALAGAVIVGIAASTTLVEGARALWTSVAMSLADASSLRLPELALEEMPNRAGAAAGFLLVAAPWAGALFAGLAGLKTRLWLLGLLPAALFSVLIGKSAVAAFPLSMVILGAAAVVGATSAREPASLARGACGAVRAVTAACALIVALLGLGVLALLAPPAAYKQLPAFSDARSALEQVAHDIRYGGQPNSLPNGKLSKLGAWQAEEKTALEIDSASCGAQYLRGFVGTQRETDGWHTLSEAKYHKSDALFWWLHESGFDATRQLSEALAASLENDDARSQLKKSGSKLGDGQTAVNVRNVAASSEYLYVPYGFSGLKDDTACKDRADENLMPRGAFGKREYGMQLVKNMTVSYPDVASVSWIAHDQDAAYWQNESNYNEFVYENYTANSEADEVLTQRLLGDAGLTESERHVDYVAAAKKVIAWLDENAVYDETAAAPQNGTDVLVDFLSGSKRGWSAHYASAAVVMLRHFGIPARYVEGYLVTPDAIDAAGEGAVEVSAKCGHAWAEMYVDGTGWVPLETVPAAREAMPQPDWTRGIEADSTKRAQVPPQPQPAEQPEQTSQLPQALVSVLVGLGIALLALLIAFDVFALVFFIVSLIRRLIARSRRKRAFADPDDTRAVCSMAAWMAEIARYRFPQIPAGDSRGLALALSGAYGEELAAEWSRAQATGRKAAFSAHGATGEERTSISAASSSFAREVAKREGAYGRWIMKYLERLM